MQDYRKLITWQKAHYLTLFVYEVTSAFPKEETYSLTSQLRRCMVSVPANIAEGAGRNTKLDFAHFLNISLGSINECSYYFLLAKDLHYISETVYDNLEKEANELKAMLIAFIKTIRKANS